MADLKSLAKNTAIEESGDSVGGAVLLDSGVYRMVVKVAHIGKSSGGAMSLNLQFEGEKKEALNATIYVTSGDAKGNKITYKDKNTGEDHYLPGFNMGNDLAQLTLGKDLSELATEEKQINKWNFDANKEVPTKVDMLTDLLGQKVAVGIIRQTVDKRAKQPDGSYKPTGETRDENEVDKFFDVDTAMTTTEIGAGAANASFVHTWTKKWGDKVRMRAVGAPAGTGTAGVPAAAPTKSLFAD